MNKINVEEYKLLKKYIDEHKEDAEKYSKFDDLTRMFINPAGVTVERYNLRLQELDEMLLREARLDKAYMDMAIALSQLSYAERAKVGCIIVNKGGQIVSQGYNGTPTGFDNCCEHDGQTKHEVLHAESNAIAKCAKWGGSTDGATLYVTMSPCYECAKVIIQAGIARVVYNEVYRDESGLQLLESAGIETWKIGEHEKLLNNEDSEDNVMRQ